MPEEEQKKVPAEQPTEKYVLINAYDELVRTNVRALMKEMDMCQCKKCFLDACALVFNRQYAHFVTTRKGELLTKIPETNYVNHAEMTVTILDALRIVKESPMH